MTAYELHDAARYALTHDSVQTADVYDGERASYYDGDVLELVVVPDTTQPPHVPPQVLATLANRGVGIREVTPKGTGAERHFVVIAS